MDAQRASIGGLSQRKTRQNTTPKDVASNAASRVTFRGIAHREDTSYRPTPVAFYSDTGSTGGKAPRSIDTYSTAEGAADVTAVAPCMCGMRHLDVFLFRLLIRFVLFLGTSTRLSTRLYLAMYFQITSLQCGYDNM